MKKRKHNFEDIIQSKLLSVVVTGRNDNYMGNFKYRITTCLNYLARNLKELGCLNDNVSDSGEVSNAFKHLQTY